MGAMTSVLGRDLVIVTFGDCVLNTFENKRDAIHMPSPHNNNSNMLVTSAANCGAASAVRARTMADNCFVHL